MKILPIAIFVLLLIAGAFVLFHKNNKAEIPAAANAETVPVMAMTSQAATSSAFVKPSDAELRARLSPLAYEVTQQGGTETPFENEYWNNHAEGIYVDVVSGDALFSSTDKYESGTGWPSFTKPITPGAVAQKSDDTLGMSRTEIVGARSGSHLGHVFDDGPAPLGLRYCMNSAALVFIPKEEMAAKGYGAYLTLFSDAKKQ